jgi:hypothetical protein
MDGSSVNAQQMFAAATLMCVIWLAALTMLVQQARFADWSDYKAPLLSGQSLAWLTYSHAKWSIE